MKLGPYLRAAELLEFLRRVSERSEQDDADDRGYRSKVTPVHSDHRSV